MEFISIDEVLQKLKVSRSYLYSLMKHDKDFPKSCRLSNCRNVVFSKNDIEEWMSNKLYKQLNIFEHHQILMEM
jgi:predicted DNA-binding transcriptional regulator AlpA